jgi:anaerobic selenocysteine-containing dehydrogenase
MQHTVVDGTNFPVESMAYDGGSTNESAYVKFMASNYGSGNVTVDVVWYTNSAQTSGNVVWGAALAAITPDTDSQDVETKAFATANTVQDSHLGTTAQRVHRASITVSNLDSIAANDYVCLWLYRNASDTSNDTLAADANVLMVEVTYSDT